MTGTLISEIEDFLRETGMSGYRFGLLAARNGRLVDRLRAKATPKGRPVRVWSETEAEIRAFIISERRRRKVAA